MNQRTPREIPLLACDAVALNLFLGRQTEDRRPLGTRPTPHPGDRYYVRECFTLFPWRDFRTFADVPFRRSPCGQLAAVYRAGNRLESTPVRWRPSIHCPKWAARTWLSVTHVATEFLQDLPDRSCYAEGIERMVVAPQGGPRTIRYRSRAGHGPDGRLHATVREAFAELWDSVYGTTPYFWSSNPEVTATRFVRDEVRSVCVPDRVLDTAAAT